MENNQNKKEYSSDKCYVYYIKADEDMLCQINNGVVEKPLICSECQKIYCKSCINEWLQKSNTCPYCIK